MKIHSGSIGNVSGGIKVFPDRFMSEGAAISYHSQTLERLNQRGGMSYTEIVANVFSLGLGYVMSNSDDIKHEKLLRHIVECIIKKGELK